MCKQAAEGIEDVRFYADNCSAQNKNQFLVTMYSYAFNHTTLKSITHNYFTVGHTQNTDDSMHSTIERMIRRTLKGGNIYTPTQYSGIILAAKKSGKPYVVTDLHYSDFLDFKKVASKYNFKTNTERVAVQWTTIK